VPQEYTGRRTQGAVKSSRHDEGSKQANRRGWATPWGELGDLLTERESSNSSTTTNGCGERCCFPRHTPGIFLATAMRFPPRIRCGLGESDSGPDWE
jgi:hypothetical protein